MTGARQCNDLPEERMTKPENDKGTTSGRGQEKKTRRGGNGQKSDWKRRQEELKCLTYDFLALLWCFVILLVTRGAGYLFQYKMHIYALSSV